MHARGGDFDRLERVLAEADEPLTAREILSHLDSEDHDFSSPHQVATVLGRRAQRGEIEVIDDRPYRYDLPEEKRAR